MPDSPNTAYWDASEPAGRNATPRLRIALINAADEGGGAEKCVMALHRGLLESGHDSTLFVGQKYSNEKGVVGIDYVRGIPGSRRLARSIEKISGLQDIYNPSFRKFISGIAHGSYDVANFHTLWGSSGFAEIEALRPLSDVVPLALTLHDTWFLSGHCACFHDCMRWQTGCGSCPDLTVVPAVSRDATQLNWMRKKSVVKHCNPHVVCVSGWQSMQARMSPIFASSSITTIYNGIDTKAFSPICAERRSELRREFGMSDQEKVVLVVGQTVEGLKQGLAAPHAIAVLNALQDQPDLRVLIVGQSADSFAEHLAVPTITRPFLSKQSALADVYRVADLCVVASEFETFGRIAAESQSCGTPVVAFGSGGLPEVVLSGIGGIVVDRGDRKSMEAAIRSILFDADLRHEMGKRARAHVVDSFDNAIITNKYASLFRSLVNRLNAC
jgi:glycosyltransferase involved in cell wall biosynthesis